MTIAKRIRALESEGFTTSDAQAVVLAEDMQKQVYTVEFESGLDWITWASDEAEAIAEAKDCVTNEVPVRAFVKESV